MSDDDTSNGAPEPGTDFWKSLSQEATSVAQEGLAAHERRQWLADWERELKRRAAELGGAGEDPSQVARAFHAYVAHLGPSFAPHIAVGTPHVFSGAPSLTERAAGRLLEITFAGATLEEFEQELLRAIDALRTPIAKGALGIGDFHADLMRLLRQLPRSVEALFHAIEWNAYLRAHGKPIDPKYEPFLGPDEPKVEANEGAEPDAAEDAEEPSRAGETPESAAEAEHGQAVDVDVRVPPSAPERASVKPWEAARTKEPPVRGWNEILEAIGWGGRRLDSAAKSLRKLNEDSSGPLCKIGKFWEANPGELRAWIQDVMGRAQAIASQREMQRLAEQELGDRQGARATDYSMHVDARPNARTRRGKRH